MNTEANFARSRNLNRRDILNLGVTAAASSVCAIASPDPDSIAEKPKTYNIVDTNVSLFRWPFRRLPLDDSAALVKKLRSLHITQAWAGSFEAVFHRDVAAVNRRLAEECQKHTKLIPMGTVNPAMPDWKDDLRRCAHMHNMPGIRLYPNYHGYQLSDTRFARLVSQATANGQFIQIVTAIEDVRTQHHLVRVEDVELAPLADVLPKIPNARVQILNCRPSTRLLDLLEKTPQLLFDTARVDGTDGVPELIKRLPPGRVLFGTHSPFLVPEAAIIRVHESGRLNESALRKVYSENAIQVFDAA